MGFIVKDDMWVKVKASHHFEDRVAVAIITRVMMGDTGWGNDRHFAMLLSDESFSEETIRKILSQHYKGVEKWQLHAIHFNFEFQRYQVMVSSPDFASVPHGCKAPMLDDFYVEASEAP